MPQSPAPQRETELQRLRDENERLRHRMRQMSAMATLGELTGTATHEFNNVLMTVINYAKLGIRNTDASSRDKALTKILDASTRAAKITNTILAQARNRSESFESVDLVKLVEDTLVLLGREMQKYRIAVETQFSAPSVPVHAIGNQLSRVLINLLINARQAIDSCGTVTVIVAAHDDGTVDLSVRDSGCGIAADVLPRIFESQFTTKDGPDAEGRGGTGLGLAACREIIENHRGRIRVESTLGVGSKFTIRLPATATAASQTRAA